MIVDATEYAFVDLGYPDANLVVFLFPDFRIQERNQFARTVAVVAAEAFARIVDLSILVPLRNRILEGVGIGDHAVGTGRQVGVVRFELQAATLGFRDHPDERNIGERIVRISAADIGVHAREPDLADVLVLDEAPPGGIGGGCRTRGLIPKLRMEGGALFIKRQRLTRPLDAG